MPDADSPIEQTLLADCTLGELLEELASDAVLPGAGTAAGIALALGAACAGKAVAITRNHLDQTNEAARPLEQLQSQLTDLSNKALALARGDALHFKDLVEADNKQDDKQKLVSTDRRIREACRELETILNTNAHHIAGNMQGDWHAARALCGACDTINAENLRESEANGS